MQAIKKQSIKKDSVMESFFYAFGLTTFLIAPLG